jgi:hypothetical protein
MEDALGINDNCTQNIEHLFSSEELWDTAAFCGCQCSICSNSDAAATATMSFPTRLMPNFQDAEKKTTSCAILASNVKDFPPNECQQFLQGKFIDLEAFCGCPLAANPTNKCSLCGDDERLSLLVDKAITDNAFDYMTCGTVDIFTRHILDEGYCFSIVELLRSECCSLTTTNNSPVAAPHHFVFPETVEDSSSKKILQSLLERVAWILCLLSVASFV